MHRYLLLLAFVLLLPCTAHAAVDVVFDQRAGFMYESDVHELVTFRAEGTLTAPIAVECSYRLPSGARTSAGTVTLTAAAPTGSFIITVVNDDVYTGTRYVATFLTFVPPGETTPVTKEGEILVAEDEPVPWLEFPTNINVDESDGAMEILVPLTLRGALPTPFTVQLVTDDTATWVNHPSATSGVDYTLLDPFVTFREGQASADVRVRIEGDDLAEGPEAFDLFVYRASDSPFYVRRVSITIIDDDVQPTLTPEDVIVFSGDPFLLEYLIPEALTRAWATPLVVQRSVPEVVLYDTRNAFSLPPWQTRLAMEMRGGIPGESIVTVTPASGTGIPPVSANVHTYHGSFSFGRDALTLNPDDETVLEITMTPGPPAEVELAVHHPTGGIIRTQDTILLGPAGTTTIPVTALAVGQTTLDLLSPGGQRIASLDVEVLPPLVLGAIAPKEGSTNGGTIVTLSGRGFLKQPCFVTFGNDPARTVSVVDDSVIRAVAPPHPAATVDVTVTCGGNAGKLPSAFTYTKPGRSRSIRH